MLPEPGFSRASTSPSVCLPVSLSFPLQCFLEIDRGFAGQLVCGSQASLRSHTLCSWYQSRALEDQKARQLSHWAFVIVTPPAGHTPGPQSRADSGGPRQLRRGPGLRGAYPLSGRGACSAVTPRPCPQRRHGICDSGVQHTCVTKPWIHSVFTVYWALGRGYGWGVHAVFPLIPRIVPMAVTLPPHWALKG